MDNIAILQNWFKYHCNGDWEHENDIVIQTLDNPGWKLSIDLVNTSLEGFLYSDSFQGTFDNWYEINCDGFKFVGYSDFMNLNTLIEKFIFGFAIPTFKKSTITYTVYASLKEFQSIKVYRPVEVKMVDMVNFEIVSIPGYDQRDLKVLKIEDFENLNVVNPDICFRVGELVTCNLIQMFDYPTLVID